MWNKDRHQTQGSSQGFHLNRHFCFSYLRGKACRWGMGGVTSFDVTVRGNLETCFQVRNGPFNTTKWHTQECIHRPHLLEPASTGLFVQQAKEKIKIGDGGSFLPVPPPGQPGLMNSMARLFTYYCFLQILGTFMVRLVSQLLLDSRPLDLVSTKHLNKFGHVPIQ